MNNSHRQLGLVLRVAIAAFVAIGLAQPGGPYKVLKPAIHSARCDACGRGHGHDARVAEPRVGDALSAHGLNCIRLRRDCQFHSAPLRVFEPFIRTVQPQLCSRVLLACVDYTSFDSNAENGFKVRGLREPSSVEAPVNGPQTGS